MEWIGVLLRFAVFVAPLLILGSALAAIVALPYQANPLKVPPVGAKWVRVWWSWVLGEISTYELIK
jgi:hypothetical protein